MECVKKNLITEITAWFSWNAYKVEQLGLLAGVGGIDSIQDKHYRHLYYVIESAYALSVDQENNISTNPRIE